MLCAATAAESDTPDNPKLTADDRANGAILITIPYGAPDMIVGIAPYDDQNARMVKRDHPPGGFHGGGTFLKIAAPGTYVFIGYLQQGHWGVCFQAASVAFDVRPGEVTVLGTLDLRPQLALLAKNARERDELKAYRSDIFQYFEGVPPPQLVYPLGKDEELAAAQEFMRKQTQGVTAPLHAGEPRPAHFVNRTNMWGTPRCGWIP
jgi:hypothetical protein